MKQDEFVRDKVTSVKLTGNSTRTTVKWNEVVGSTLAGKSIP